MGGNSATRFVHAFASADVEGEEDEEEDDDKATDCGAGFGSGGEATRVGRWEGIIFWAGHSCIL